MPSYNFINENTNTEEVHNMKMSELDVFKESNPHLRQIIKEVALGDSVRLGVTKTPESFNSLLKHIKKGNSKGFTKSTINTR